MSGFLHGTGDLIGDRYAITDFIGQGGMQEVYMAHDNLLSRNVALKTPKNSSASKRFKRSAVLSAKVNHNNVAKTLDYLEFGHRYYLIEEFVDGCDLGAFFSDYVRMFDPFAAARALHHLAKGLAASHHVGVVHRDLKPSNIMILGGKDCHEFKITDFGIAKMAAEEIDKAASADVEGLTNSQTALGALPYMAPETIDDIKSIGKPADIWALGALSFEMLCGSRPFGTGYKAVPLIQAAKLPPLPDAVTSKKQFKPFADALYTIISGCMKKDPDDRLTADKLVIACEGLHYTNDKRSFGVVNNLKSGYGFIAQTGSPSTFFHQHSVYPLPAAGVGQKVWFAAYAGSPKKRAFPVTIAN